MDGQKKSSTDVKEAPTTERHRKFFMDVRKPKPVSAAPASVRKPDDVKAPEKAVETSLTPVATEPGAPKPPLAPAVPPEETSEKTEDPANKLEEPKKAEKPMVTKPPKPPRQPGIGLAIFATMVIVLGLSALATYAYLRTNNIAVF